MTDQPERTTSSSAARQWSEDDGIDLSPFEGEARCEGATHGQPGQPLGRPAAEWRVAVHVTDDGESWVACRDCALGIVAENMTMLTNMRDGVDA